MGRQTEQRIDRSSNTMILTALQQKSVQPQHNLQHHVEQNPEQSSSQQMKANAQDKALSSEGLI